MTRTFTTRLTAASLPSVVLPFGRSECPTCRLRPTRAPSSPRSRRAFNSPLASPGPKTRMASAARIRAMTSSVARAELALGVSLPRLSTFGSMSLVAASSSVTVNIGRLPRLACGPNLLPGRRPRGSLRPPRSRRTVASGPHCVRSDHTCTARPHEGTARSGPSSRCPAGACPARSPPRPLGPGLAMGCRRGTSASQQPHSHSPPLTLPPTANQAPTTLRADSRSAARNTARLSLEGKPP